MADQRDAIDYTADFNLGFIRVNTVDLHKLVPCCACKHGVERQRVSSYLLGVHDGRRSRAPSSAADPDSRFMCELVAPVLWLLRGQHRAHIIRMHRQTTIAHRKVVQRHRRLETYWALPGCYWHGSHSSLSGRLRIKSINAQPALEWWRVFDSSAHGLLV